MPATYRAVSSAAADTGNVVVTKPSGTVDGDLLLAVHFQDPDGSAANQTASGWTQVGSTQDNAVGSTKVWRKAASSEGANYTFGGDGGASGVVIIIRIDGHDAGSPIDVTATFGTGGSSVSHVAPAVSPAGSDSLLVCGAYALVEGAALTYTAPGTMTERADVQPSGQWVAGTLATQGLAASGSTGTRTFTASTAKAWNAFSLAVASAASATNLVVADAAQAQAADNLALTQVHQLAVADATQAQPVDNVVLTQVHQLVVADALQGQTVDNLTLSVANQLVVADATQAQSVDNLTLTQVHQLVVQDSTQGQTVDNISLATGVPGVTVTLPEGLVPVRALSESEILTGNRSARLRYDLYDKDEAALGNLTGVMKGSIDYTANASVHSGGSLDIVDVGQSVDWLNDRVRPVVIIDGIAEEIPLGMFLFSEAPEEWSDTGREWSVKLLDKCTILEQDKVDGTYSLAAGAVITDAVVDLIESTGETNIAITPSAATLAAPLSWEATTSKLKIVNDLLDAAGYFSLWCDGNGQYRGEPYVRPANRPIRYEFLDGATSIYSPDFVKDVDLHGIPNKFVAVGQGNGTTEALTSVATNEDPASPYSFSARGRWIVDGATGVEAASQTVLDDYARRRLIELTSPTSSITVAHALVPNLTFNNAVRLRRVPAGVDARHVVSKMVITLDPTALVKSTLVEVVDL